MLFAALMVACGTVPERKQPPPPSEADTDSIPDAVPRDEPMSRYGNPESYVVLGKRYRTLKRADGFKQRGIASWYGNEFHGRRTSSGEIYDMYRMTAAHAELPLPSYVEVTNLENGRRAVVRVNDRGPFHSNRVIDLSYVAAKKLDMIGNGTAFVELRAVSGPRAPALTERGVTPPAMGAGPAPAVAGAMYLQVGAFRDSHNAEALRARLQGRLASPVEVKQSIDAGKPLFRVQIGPIADVPSADGLVAALKRIGIDDHYFVTN
jgi:rare lipoprotein A